MSDLISRADAIEAVRNVMCNKIGSWYDLAVFAIEALSALPSAEAEPTVIRSRTFMPTKDFKELAKRIREVNPNAVVIPCDAEEVVRCKDCKHYGATDCQIQESFYGIKDFDFCSYGERKGGDDE